MEGLPTPSWGFSRTTITSGAVHDDRLYVGVTAFNSNAGEQSGVYVFDPDTETWSSAGLAKVRITDLLSHDSILYAGTWNGIYASTPQRGAPTCEGGHDMGARETGRSCARLTTCPESQHGNHAKNPFCLPINLL